MSTRTTSPINEYETVESLKIEWQGCENCFEVVEPFFDYDDNYERVYVGSVMSLYPSGKFYMPWACSNVEPCPHCSSKGKDDVMEDCPHCGNMGSKEAWDDECFRETLEAELERRGWWMESGNGDPTDVFFCRPIQESNA